MKREVSTCPEVSWFRFVHCTLKSCKHNTSSTPSGCMALDRVAPDGNKPISDQELKFYKFPDSPIGVRMVSERRKQAVSRILRSMLFYGFVQHIRKTGTDQDWIFPLKILRARERNFPFKAAPVQFENWMWRYVLDENCYQQFTSTTTADSKAISLHEILFLTEQELANLRSAIYEFVSQHKEYENAKVYCSTEEASVQANAA